MVLELSVQVGQDIHAGHTAALDARLCGVLQEDGAVHNRSIRRVVVRSRDIQLPELLCVLKGLLGQFCRR